MDKWIEEISAKSTARVHYKKGHLEAKDCTVSYYPGDNDILLTGTFTIEQLEALVAHMKKYNKG